VNVPFKFSRLNPVVYFLCLFIVSTHAGADDIDILVSACEDTSSTTTTTTTTTPSSERPHVVFVVDNSTSMRNNNLGNGKSRFDNVVDSLECLIEPDECDIPGLVNGEQPANYNLCT
jgi:hypothetical protein